MNSQRTLLGQMIMDSTVYYQALLNEAMFDPGINRDVYRVVRDRYEAGEDVDLVLIVQDLKGKYNPADVAEITDSVPSAANWSYHATAVRQDWMRSRLGALAREVLEDLKSADPIEVIESMTQKAAGLTVGAGREVRRASSYLLPFVNEVERRYHAKGALPGIESGFERLDQMTLGFRDRSLYIIGARPSDGKTAAALTLVAEIAGHQQIPTGILSLESAGEELISRLVSIEGGIRSRALESGILKPVDFKDLTDVATSIQDWPLYIYDEPNMPLHVLKAKAREMVSSHGIKILFVDYIQIVRRTNYQIPFREHMNDVSMSLKQLARELSIPVIALAQVGRDAEGGKPQLKHLKESGQIEQDADGVILIHHHENGCDWIVAKMRNGPKGAVRVIFDGERVRFLPYTSDAERLHQMRNGGILSNGGTVDE